MAMYVALQCYRCGTMQAKQQKKSSNKWTCAICNEKQSLRKVFARSGYAKDIRCFVQRFNLAAAAHEPIQEEHLFHDPPPPPPHLLDNAIDKQDQQPKDAEVKSKWSDYMPDEVEQENDDDDYGFVTTVAEAFAPLSKTKPPNKRRKQNHGFHSSPNPRNPRSSNQRYVEDTEPSDNESQKYGKSNYGLAEETSEASSQERCHKSEETAAAPQRGRPPSKWDAYLPDTNG